MAVGLAVDFAAVPDAVDAHDSQGISDFVNYAVIAHADSSVVICSYELPTTRRTRISCQALNCYYHAIMKVR